MSNSLAAICANLSKIAGRAVKEDQPLIADLARETHALCLLVQQMEQAGDGNGNGRRRPAG